MPIVASRHELGSPGLPWGSWVSFYEPAEIHRMVEGEYEQWRQWRYQHISIEFQLQTHLLARFMWEQKRPWWVSL